MAWHQSAGKCSLAYIYFAAGPDLGARAYRRDWRTGWPVLTCYTTAHVSTCLRLMPTGQSDRVQTKFVEPCLSASSFR
jgi:hypothetical protein